MQPHRESGTAEARRTDLLHQLPCRCLQHYTLQVAVAQDSFAAAGLLLLQGQLAHRLVRLIHEPISKSATRHRSGVLRRILARCGDGCALLHWQPLSTQ